MLTSKWKKRTAETHKKHLELYSGKEFDVAFLGDSMMERWLSTKFWTQHFSNYANLGVGGDCLENLFYRISAEDNVTSILDTIKAKKIVLMIGTNNTEKKKPSQICEGIEQIIKTIFEKQANVELIVYNITYREDVPNAKIDEINNWLEKYIKDANNNKLVYRYLKVSKKEMIDHVHLNEHGYRVWYNDLKTFL